MKTIYLAGGCLWSVQYFMKYIPGVIKTEAGRANGTTHSLDGPYDGYAECVKVTYDEKKLSVPDLMGYLLKSSIPTALTTRVWTTGKIPYRRVQRRGRTAGGSPPVHCGKARCRQDPGRSASSDQLHSQCPGTPGPPGKASGGPLPLQHSLESSEEV